MIFLLAKGLQKSYRYRYHGEHHLKEAQNISPHGGYLLALWHQNLLPGLLAHRGRPHAIMVSRSSDARPIRRLVERFGHFPCLGSSQQGRPQGKGGREAAREMIGYLKKGIPGAITVDGPGGPAMVAKPGVVAMAQKAQAPIVPYALCPRRFWALGTWDSLKIPWPGTLVDVFYGAPLAIEGEFSEVLHRLEQALKKLGPH